MYPALPNIQFDSTIMLRAMNNQSQWMKDVDFAKRHRSDALFLHRQLVAIMVQYINTNCRHPDDNSDYIISFLKIYCSYAFGDSGYYTLKMDRDYLKRGIIELVPKPNVKVDPNHIHEDYGK